MRILMVEINMDEINSFTDYKRVRKALEDAGIKVGEIKDAEIDRMDFFSDDFNYVSRKSPIYLTRKSPIKYNGKPNEGDYFIDENHLRCCRLTYLGCSNKYIREDGVIMSESKKLGWKPIEKRKNNRGDVIYYMLTDDYTDRRKINKTAKKILADCFIENPEWKKSVYLVDGNNDNLSLDNIKWGDSPNSTRGKARNKHISDYRIRVLDYYTGKDLGEYSLAETQKRFNITYQQIHQVLAGKSRRAKNYSFIKIVKD